MSENNGSFRSLWAKFKAQIVQDVPAEDALCEFDCRKEQCTEGEWASCHRRLRRAAGETWPLAPATASVEASPQAEVADTDGEAYESAD